MKWRPIETAPKDGTRVLLWCYDTVKDGWFEKRDDLWTEGWETAGCYDVGWRTLYPTHWMPLPPAPTTGDDHAE